MLDLETMGTRAGCAIASIGACEFIPSTGEINPNTFYEVVELQSCFDVGLKVHASTLYWWLEQSPEARAALMVKDRIILQHALSKLANWLGREEMTVWANGANFDFPVLETAYHACKFPVVPWVYNTVRDARTIYRMAGVRVNQERGTYHHALDDCKNQVEALARAFSVLNFAWVK